MFGLAILTLAGAIALLAYRSSYQEAIYPNVYVAGMNLSGMNEAEASAAVEQKAAELEGTRAYFDYDGQRWAPTMAELGVTVDVDKTVADAMAVGRGGGARDQVAGLLETTRTDHYIPISTTIDDAMLDAWLDQVDADLGINPVNANIVISDGVATITPEQDGTVIDRVAIQGLLADSVERLEAPGGKLPVTPSHPAVYAVDLAGTKATLDAALSQPVQVTYDGRSWTLQPADLGQFILVSTDESKTGAEAVTYSVDDQALTQYLSQTIAPDVEKEAVDARIAWNHDTSTIYAVSESQTGIKIQPATFASNVSASMFGGHTPVELPVTETQPVVNSSNLESLGITTLLATGDSAYYGSGYERATNIEVGVSLLNGTMIPPHSTFSFNHAIGVISTDAGFIESQVIDGEQIGRDVGGGICQVSTTVFRAALLAGLPITEWHPHRFRLKFYEYEGWTYGLDASILQPEDNPLDTPGSDFKFENPTDSWMLIESFAEGEQAYVRIYGPETGYTINISEPSYGETYPPIDQPEEIVDPELPAGTILLNSIAREGMDVTYWRTVYDADGNEVLSDEFYTHFYPSSDVYKVSPDMEGLSPAYQQ